ncbi:MAG: hypothetical protein K2J15_00480, partial [Muribaculaceae bacterium]|nr:hypothetical protein [Muribaculaceae bacterium]
LLASFSTVFADRSISLVINPENPSDVLEWDNYSDTGNIIGNTPEINTLFTGFTSAVLSNIAQNDSYTSFLHTCIYTIPGQAASHKTFLVMSPNVYEEWTGQVYPINENVDYAQWTLKLAGNPWKIKRIELDAVNYGMVNPYDNGQYSSGIIRVNGKEQVMAKNTDLTVLGFDFEGSDREMSEIILYAPKGSAVGICTIRIIPDIENEFVTLPGMSAELDFSNEGSYILPASSFGSFNYPDLMLATVLDSEGNVKDMDYKYLGDSQFQIFPKANAEPLQEGRYGICYYYDDGIYKPTWEDAIPFSIVPGISELYVNFNKIDSANRHCDIPYSVTHNVDGNEVTYSWSNAQITGHKDGTNIYWKVYHDGTKIKNYNRTAGVILRATEDNDIPDGYNLLTDDGINLNGGNHLSLILERNGVRSQPHDISYTAVNVPTSITAVTCESDIILKRNYTLNGSLISSGDFENYQGIYIEEIILSNGNSISHKLSK